MIYVLTEGRRGEQQGGSFSLKLKFYRNLLPE
jgi:hypothetical protein